MLKILVIVSNVVNSLYIPINEYKYIVPKKIYKTELNSIFNKKKINKYSTIKSNFTNENLLNLNYKIMNNTDEIIKQSTKKELCLTVKKFFFFLSIIIICYFLQIITSFYRFLKIFTDSINKL